MLHGEGDGEGLPCRPGLPPGRAGVSACLPSQIANAAPGFSLDQLTEQQLAEIKAYFEGHLGINTAEAQEGASGPNRNANFDYRSALTDRIAFTDTSSRFYLNGCSLLANNATTALVLNPAAVTTLEIRSSSVAI